MSSRRSWSSRRWPPRPPACVARMRARTARATASRGVGHAGVRGSSRFHLLLAFSANASASSRRQGRRMPPANRSCSCGAASAAVQLIAAGVLDPLWPRVRVATSREAQVGAPLHEGAAAAWCSGGCGKCTRSHCAVKLFSRLCYTDGTAWARELLCDLEFHLQSRVSMCVAVVFKTDWLWHSIAPRITLDREVTAPGWSERQRSLAVFAPPWRAGPVWAAPPWRSCCFPEARRGQGPKSGCGPVWMRPPHLRLPPLS